ncbi:cytochrome b [Methylopila musalis]|uniref:Cytochrome b n=1 Tax=Methylopila musalis TaxID=1134781 RepID=A0ABW3Z8M4_9HYPH
MTCPALTLLDRPAGYGRISRALHALVATLVLWQFAMVLAYRVLGEHNATLNAIYGVASHGPVGLGVFLLMLARIPWALANARRRPAYDAGVLGRVARASHALMYALLFAIPGVALARVYAKGEGWVVYGLSVVPATGEPIPAVKTVVDALHGPMSWTLLALIVAHVGAALLHGLVWRDGMVGRMFGRPPATA